MAVKAKFRCNSVTDFGGQKQAQLTAVYSQTGENADFAQATPSGDLKINIDSGVPASNFFKPGNSYYLTFEEAANKFQRGRLFLCLPLTAAGSIAERV